MSSDEEPLSSGNMASVVRVGDTVRRTSGPWTPTVHRLLRQLRERRVTELPEPLGLDDQGREILAYRPGWVASYPAPALVVDTGSPPSDRPASCCAGSTTPPLAETVDT